MAPNRGLEIRRVDRDDRDRLRVAQSFEAPAAGRVRGGVPLPLHQPQLPDAAGCHDAADAPRATRSYKDGGHHLLGPGADDDPQDRARLTDRRVRADSRGDRGGPGREEEAGLGARDVRVRPGGGGDGRAASRGGPRSDFAHRAASRGHEPRGRGDVPLHVGRRVPGQEQAEGVELGQEAVRGDQAGARPGAIQAGAAPRGRRGPRAEAPGRQARDGGAERGHDGDARARAGRDRRAGRPAARAGVRLGAERAQVRLRVRDGGAVRAD
mmetsp:Transcript_4784/g.19125  ORF Transcript_4784/g.19125 Transcript_4784/m.19125 type:complete len:268 (+) Transcript_4784:653-1456(+)